MPVASALRHVRRLLPTLAFLLSSGCSDAPVPTAPRIHAPLAALAASFVVTNTDDAGPGSLRQAVIDAPDNSLIQFDAALAGQQIVLSSGQIILDKSLTIEGSALSGNTVSGGLLSRAFDVDKNGIVLLRNLSIVDGRDSLGGGVLNKGVLTLDHVLVANNETTGHGGGIYSNGALLLLVNTTVSGNVAGGYGGGITSTDLSIRNSTVASNVSGLPAGGIVAFSALSLRNSIVDQNKGPGGVESDCFYFPNAYFSLGGRNLTSDANCGNDPSWIFDVAQLLPLANNGGPTWSHALADGSAAIDQGLACTESTDQRYVDRPQGTTCDIGAFEYNSFGSYNLVIDPNIPVTAKTGLATLTGTISCSRSALVPTTLLVGISQTQKVTGRFSTIITGTASLVVPSCGTSATSWSVPVVPQAGQFSNGAATGTATTSQLPSGFLPASVSATLKLFNAK